MKQTLFIPIRFPSWNELLNAASIRRGSWSKYWAIKKDLTEQVKGFALDAGLKAMSMVRLMVFTYHEPNKRRDKDNVTAAKKFILDGLVHAGVLADDSPRYIEATIDRVIYKGESPGYRQPGVEVTMKGKEKG